MNYYNQVAFQRDNYLDSHQDLSAAPSNISYSRKTRSHSIYQSNFDSSSSAQPSQKQLQIEIYEKDDLEQKQRAIPLEPVNDIRRISSDERTSQIFTEEQEFTMEQDTTKQNETELIQEVIPQVEQSTQHEVYENTVKSYAAITDSGIVRKHNEDRVTIIQEIIPPKDLKYLNTTKGSLSTWPKCSFFGVYDGHGGSACADYLQENLHRFIITDEDFPENPREALANGFAKAEESFLAGLEKEHQLNENYVVDNSGSCANVVLIVGDMCYIANTGDSRAILSMNQGDSIIELSIDHKPNEPNEKLRIYQAGGSVYQQVISQVNGYQQQTNVMITPRYGPFRTNPGRLSISRAFGNVKVKKHRNSRQSSVVIAEPDIQQIRLVQRQHDFILIGCDGIFDRMSSNDAVKSIWTCMENIQNSQIQQKTCQELCEESVKGLINEAKRRLSTDNLTAIIIAFKQPEINNEKLKNVEESEMETYRLQNNHAISNFCYVKSSQQIASGVDVEDEININKGLSGKSTQNKLSDIDQQSQQFPVSNNLLLSSLKNNSSSTKQEKGIGNNNKTLYKQSTADAVTSTMTNARCSSCDSSSTQSNFRISSIFVSSNISTKSHGSPSIQSNNLDNYLRINDRFNSYLRDIIPSPQVLRKLHTKNITARIQMSVGVPRIDSTISCSIRECYPIQIQKSTIPKKRTPRQSICSIYSRRKQYFLEYQNAHQLSSRKLMSNISMLDSAQSSCCSKQLP